MRLLSQHRHPNNPSPGIPGAGMELWQLQGCAHSQGSTLWGGNFSQNPALLRSLGAVPVPGAPAQRVLKL